MLVGERGSRLKPSSGDRWFLGEGLADLGDALQIGAEGGDGGIVQLLSDGNVVHLREREQNIVAAAVMGPGERVAGVGSVSSVKAGVGAPSTVCMGPRLRGDDGGARGGRV